LQLVDLPAGEPVIAHLSERVITISANGTIDEVYEQVVVSLKIRNQ
jgi:hypothetical protein